MQILYPVVELSPEIMIPYEENLSSAEISVFVCQYEADYFLERSQREESIMVIFE